VQLTLEQLLSVVGSLDDTPGFDTPRERFRRFISKRITDFPTARELVEQCMRLPGLQSHRALEDLVIALGRFLDFEVVFGSYERSSIVTAGGWRARRELFIHVAVWTDHTPTIDIARLTGSPLDGQSTSGEGESHVGLGIVTPLFPAATRLGDLKANRGDIPVYALSLRLLLQLTEMVVDGRATHSLVLALLTRSPVLDDLVNGLEGLQTIRTSVS
jgi:hypothetical protein